MISYSFHDAVPYVAGCAGPVVFWPVYGAQCLAVNEGDKGRMHIGAGAPELHNSDLHMDETLFIAVRQSGPPDIRGSWGRVGRT